MGHLKCQSDNKRGKSISLAKQDFINGIKPSIHSAARSTYNIPFTTLRDCLCGQQPHSEAHQGLQLLTSPKAIPSPWATVDFRPSGVTPVLSRPRVPTGSPQETHGNRFTPTSPTTLTITHRKSPICENRRLGTCSFHVLYFFIPFLGPRLLCPTLFFITLSITQFGLLWCRRP